MMMSFNKSGERRKQRQFGGLGGVVVANNSDVTLYWTPLCSPEPLTLKCAPELPRCEPQR